MRNKFNTTITYKYRKSRPYHSIFGSSYSWTYWKELCVTCATIHYELEACGTTNCEVLNMPFIIDRLNMFLRKNRQFYVELTADACNAEFMHIELNELEKIAKIPHKLFCSLVVPSMLKYGIHIKPSGLPQTKLISDGMTIEEAIINLDMNE